MDRITDELIFELWAVKHLMDDRGLPKREALETSKEILNRLTSASEGEWDDNKEVAFRAVKRMYAKSKETIDELKKEVERLKKRIDTRDRLIQGHGLESLKQQPDCVELLEWMRDKVVTHPKGVWMVWDGTNYIGYKTDSELLALYQSNTKDE